MDAAFTTQFTATVGGGSCAFTVSEQKNESEKQKENL